MNASERFPLSFAGRLLANLTPPEAPFDPLGSWENFYRIYCMVVNVEVPAGTLRVRRQAAGAGARLEVEQVKSVGSGSHRIVTAVDCATDALSTPRQWRLTTHAAGPAGDLSVTYAVERKRAALEVDAKGKRSKVAVTGPCTCAWMLFDAVQRWPHDLATTSKFTLISPEGSVLGERVLRYRESVEATLGGRTIRLHAVQHTGTGALPWIYYTDDRGRLLVAISGLEVYLLETRSV